MKAKFVCLLLFSAVTSAGYAQQAKSQKYTLSGVLCDSLTHEPEPFATVRLLDNGKAIKVSTTQTDGHFSIAAPKMGTYQVEWLSLGKAPLRRTMTFDASHSTIHADTLYIKEYNATLGTATITAQRPLVKAEIDKMTYSMAEDPDAKTNSLLEMLRKVPMVTVAQPYDERQPLNDI